MPLWRAIPPLDLAVHRQDRRRDLAKVVRPLRPDRQIPRGGGGIGRKREGRGALARLGGKKLRYRLRAAVGFLQRSIRIPSLRSSPRSAMKLWIQRSSFCTA